MITDFGGAISSTLQNLFNKPVTDEAIEASIKEICTTLIKANVNTKLVQKFRDEIKERIEKEKLEKNVNKTKLVHNAFYSCLVKFLDPETKPYIIEKGRPNVVVFVGLQGCGKTTSICKYANYYKRKGLRVGVVCADTFRAGAFDQIKQNLTKINIPYFGSDDPDPVKVAKEGVMYFRKNDYDLILVDTSGRHSQESALFTEMKDLVSSVKPDNIVFIMDAGIGQSAETQAIAFKESVSVGGIILTKLDGASKSGGALSSVAATKCPIEFVGTGEGMNDFEVFEAKRFVSKMLGMGDLEGLVEKFSSIDIDQTEMVDKLTSGTFRLIDFKNILSQILSLGPISKMLEMIPGMSNMPLPDESKFSKITYMFDSMTKKELESNGDLFVKQPTRLNRVSKGSGTSKEFCMEILSNFKLLAGMMKKMMSNPMMAQMLSGGDINPKDKKKIMDKAKGKIPSNVIDYMDSLN